MENHHFIDRSGCSFLFIWLVVGENASYFGDFAMPGVAYALYADKLQLKIQFANIESQMAGASAKICRAQTET